MRSVSRPDNSIATIMGRIVLVSIALLIVTVGVLETESRVPQAMQGSARHTSKISYAKECSSGEVAPTVIDRVSPVCFVQLQVVARHCSATTEFVLPKFTGFARALGLRAPPLV
jgi:hypothetical protein